MTHYYCNKSTFVFCANMGIDLPFCFQDANDILEVIIKSEKFENPKVTFLQGSKVGEGYLGVNSAVEISDGNKTLHLFVKAAPKHEKLRQMYCLKEAYGNEFHFYKDVLPIMQRMVKKKTGKSLELVPKMYAGNIDDMKEIFVFENLITKGFALSITEHVFSKEQALLVMKGYGEFHGISYALKDQDAQAFSAIIKDIPDVFRIWVNSMESTIPVHCKIIEKYLELPKESAVLEKLTYISKNVLSLFTKLNKYEGGYRIIVHGDSNYNNMMFKIQGNDLELRLLDFQAMKLSLPVQDLSYFFYSSASSKENLAELELFLTTYYNSLSSTIRELGSDPDKVCPFSVIKDQWKEFCVFGLLMAMIVLPTMVNDGDPFNIVELIEHPESRNTKNPMNNEEEYANRIKYILQHFIDNNFI